MAKTGADSGRERDERLERLSDLVKRLRGPGGCPWDREQRLEDVRAYLLEEAHEVGAAIDDEDWGALSGELGDLLFQLVFIARLAEERQAFTMTEVVDRIEAKMIERHPHVFGGEPLADAREVSRAWERRKLESGGEHRSLLAGVPASLPALVAAYRMTQKAAAVGFDWPHAAAVREKLDEELDELAQAGPATDSDRPEAEHARPDAAVEEEIGDVLFTMANLARHLGVDPERALAAANRKFRRRFAGVEEVLARRGRAVGEVGLDELESAWQEVKAAERRPAGE